MGFYLKLMQSQREGTILTGKKQTKTFNKSFSVSNSVLEFDFMCVSICTSDLFKYERAALVKLSL